MRIQMFTLRPKPPYKITPHIATFTLSNKPTPCLYENGCCRRAFQGRVFEVCVDGEPYDPIITVKVYRGFPEDVKEVIEHIYNVKLDYEDFIKCCEGFDELYDIALRYEGLRPALAPTLYEALIKAIISQQVPQRIALSVISKVVTTFGECFEYGGKVFYDFPYPDVLANVSPVRLRMLGLSMKKAEYVVSISEAVIGGYDLESVKKLKPSEAINELMRFKGVGKWTAKLAIMASTGNLSLDLLEDKAVLRGFTFLGIGPDTLKEFMRRCEKYVGLLMYLLALYYEERRRLRFK